MHGRPRAVPRSRPVAEPRIYHGLSRWKPWPSTRARKATFRAARGNGGSVGGSVGMRPSSDRSSGSARRVSHATDRGRSPNVRSHSPGRPAGPTTVSYQAADDRRRRIGVAPAADDVRHCCPEVRGVAQPRLDGDRHGVVDEAGDAAGETEPSGKLDGRLATVGAIDGEHQPADQFTVSGSRHSADGFEKGRAERRRDVSGGPGGDCHGAGSRFGARIGVGHAGRDPDERHESIEVGDRGTEDPSPHRRPVPRRPHAAAVGTEPEPKPKAGL